MVRDNNNMDIKTSESAVGGDSVPLHSDMKLDATPSSLTDGKSSEHRRPQHHESSGSGRIHGASSAVSSGAGAGVHGLPPPSAVGLNSEKSIVMNSNSDGYQPNRKRHHSSSSPAVAARTAIRNSSVHSSTSSGGSGGEHGNTSKTTTTGASVKFAMPPKDVAGGSATGSSLSLTSDEDMNSKKMSALKQKHTAGAGTKSDGTKSPPASHSSGSRSKSSSSGSDGNEGGATSSSNPAVVTQSTYNNTSGSGGGDTRSTSGSGSGSDGGQGGNNRRNGGEKTKAKWGSRCKELWRTTQKRDSPRGGVTFLGEEE